MVSIYSPQGHLVCGIKGTLGTVVYAQQNGAVSPAGTTTTLLPLVELWVVSVQFDKSLGTPVDFIGRELYDHSLEELP